MRALEEERLRALDTASAARAQVAELTEAQRRLEWQSRLLEKMSDVQLRHNKRKSDAIKELLTAKGADSGRGGWGRYGASGGGIAADGLDGGSSVDSMAGDEAASLLAGLAGSGLH